VTAVAWVGSAVFAIAAVANWATRWTGNRRVELWSKPLALGALIVVALAIEPAEPTVRAWFVVALACSLAGDVFLLDDRRFVPGLVAFLFAHVAYTIGLALDPEWSLAAMAPGVVLMLIVGGWIGRRIVAGAEREAPILGWAVIAYLVAISLMFATAVATRNPWAAIGAGLFVASDSILGWRKFVAEARWMSVAVMVTYHLGQLGLVISLV
jgi:uncharacterized membrane protein YhhN